MKIEFLAILVALLTVGKAAASDGTISSQLVKDFASFCASNPGRPEKTAAAANLADLALVEPEIFLAFGPQTPPENIAGWYVANGPSGQALLAATEASIDGEATATCTIYSNLAVAGDVVTELKDWIVLQKPDFDETSFGNRMRLWRTEMMFEPVRLILSNPADDSTFGVSLGIVSKHITK